MAQLINLFVLVVCVNLLHFTVLAQPAQPAQPASAGGSATTSTTTGAAGSVVGGASGGAGSSASGGVEASGGSSALEGQTTSAGGETELQSVPEDTIEAAAETASTISSAMTNGMPQIMNQAYQFALANGQVNPASFFTALVNLLISGKYATAENASQMAYSMINRWGNEMLALGGSTLSNGVTNARQWPNMVAAGARDAMLAAIDYADQGSGLMNGNIRQVVIPAADMMDSSLGAFGVRPFANDMASRGWNFGEEVRGNVVQSARQPFMGGFQVPFLGQSAGSVGESTALGGGGFGSTGRNSFGGGNGFAFGSVIPTAGSVQAEAEIA